ncbi:SART-1 family protein DOT2 [Tanacetum coccineum]
MDRSDSRHRRSVGTRDHDESTRDERWKGGYDDTKAKHRSKENSGSSKKEDKDCRIRDRERSKISDVSKKRDMEYKDVSRKKDVNDREKDKTWEDDKTLKNKTNAKGEQRLKRKSDDASDVVSWVSKIRKLENKRNAENEKALHFEDQDNVTQEEDEDEPPANRHTSRDLVGFKVLDGLDKVVEGGAVVLTLNDQNILADGDINQEVDMLENVEIGEQKRRNEAYKAVKKDTGVYDTFIKETGFEKKMLPQYDDPIVNEGVTLDERGDISGEAEKRIEELRGRIDDASVTPHFEDLTSSEKVSTDYYTTEARFAGLDLGDHGSWSDGKRQDQKEEHERTVAEKRNNAFQFAYMKADEASKALRMEPTVTVQRVQEEEEFAFGADDDLHKSLERARKLALKMKDGTPSGPHAIALFATSNSKNTDAENRDSQENRVVLTETEEFVWSLQRDEEARNLDAEDVAPATSEQEQKSKVGGRAEMKDVIHHVKMAEKEVKPDETIHESSLGKGLSGALQLLKDQGTLKDTVERVGRNMDKKKSKLVGLVNENDDDKKEIRIERTDEYGRTLTLIEAFRQFSHKFHGIMPGKKKQEKRRRQDDGELKVKKRRTLHHSLLKE